jgi:geranylgeranyl diphosphate synthase type II
VDGALARLEGLVKASIAAIPDCHGAAELQSIIASEAKRLRPKSLAQSAA